MLRWEGRESNKFNEPGRRDDGLGSEDVDKQGGTPGKRLEAWVKKGTGRLRREAIID